MKRLNAFICDKCNIVIRDRLFKHITKKGVEKHFCSQKCLIIQMNKFSLTDDQALQFIMNSNEIEEIYHDISHYERGVANKKHQFYEINGQLQSLKFLTNLSIQKKIDIETICKLHKILMKDLLGPLEHGIRKCLVRVGWRLCPYPVELIPMLETWCKKVNTFKNPTEDDVWQAHLAYECLPAGTFLTGVNKNVEDVRVGDKVLDQNGKLTTVTHLMNQQFKGKMFTIKAGLIPSFSVTDNHPLLVSEYSGKRFSYTKRELGVPKFVRADQLKLCTDFSGHYLLIPKYKKREYKTLLLKSFIKFDNKFHKLVKIHEVCIDSELAWVLGFYTAEGCYSEKSQEISFGCHQTKDLPYIKKVNKFFERYHYKQGRIYTQKNSKGIDFTIGASVLGRAFSEWCGKGAYNKKIPDFILYNKNEEIIRAFLDGFYCGDGADELKWGRKMLYTISPTLAHQLQLTILNLGESACINVENENYCALSKDPTHVYPIYWVAWFKHSYKTIQKLKNFYAIPIRKVTFKKVDIPVYNLETKSHTYTINNIITHNCIHPFIDGNGRSGRLIWLWLRFKHGFGYNFVNSKTKRELYYPQFDKFNWEKWNNE